MKRLLITLSLALPSIAGATADLQIYPEAGYPYISGTVGTSKATRGYVDAVRFGDINGDGADDLLMQEEYYGFGAIELGGTPISQKRATSKADTTITVADGFCEEGNRDCSFTYIGDINADGFEDLLVSDSSEPYYATTAYIYYGSATLPATIDLPTDAAATITLPSSTADATWLSVAGVGDVSGDGIDDLSVGYLAATTVGSDYEYDGTLYYFFGEASATPLTGAVDLTTADATITSSSASGLLLYTDNRHLDLSGDGINDLLLTTYVYEDGEFSNTTYSLFYGPLTAGNTETSLSSDALLTPTSTATSLVTVGDLNGDGAEDFVTQIGSELYVYFGSATELWTGDMTLGVTTADLVFPVTCSCVLAGADLNNDGFSDLFIGTSSGSYTGPYGKTITGAIDVYYGSSTLNLDDPAISYIGYTTATAGDLNGDNKTDLAFLKTYSEKPVRLGYSVNSDGDDYTGVLGDCRNNNKRVFPGQQDNTANLIDDDCDGVVDEGYTYSYKQDGKLVSITRNGVGTVATLEYERSKRKVSYYVASFGSGSKSPKLWAILADGKRYINVDTYFEGLSLRDSYSLASVTTRDLRRANKSPYEGYYDYYGAVKAFINPLTGDEMIVVAKKIRNSRETILRPFVVTADNKFTAKDSLTVKGSRDKIHTLTWENDLLTLSVNDESLVTITVTDHNQLEQQAYEQ